MSYFEGTIFSQALNCDTHICAILPQDTRPHWNNNGQLKDGLKPRDEAKTLILLHGLTDCDSTWCRRTSIERYAEVNDVAVIMPDGGKSFYCDMVYGGDYFQYITEELPQLASQLFHVAVSADDLYIAGLSMGGYGALKCALTYPERYAACGAFSSGCDVRGRIKSEVKRPDALAKDYEKVMKAVFGDPIDIPDTSDIFWLADHMKPASRKLNLMMTCGRQDFLHAANVELKKKLETNDAVDLRYEEWDGIHEWGFWDVSIQKFFDAYIH